MPESDLDAFVREFPDRSLRKILGEAANLLALVSFLDPALAAAIDPRTIRGVPTARIDPRLRERRGDLLFRARLRGSRRTIWIYLLLEHQSTADCWMPVRVLHAMGGIWDDERRRIEAGRGRGGRYLPRIVPIVFYTGRKRWPDPVGFGRLFHPSDRHGEYEPVLPVLFLDLAASRPGPLDRVDHPLAAVLRLLREERASRGEFELALREAVRVVDAASGSDRDSWRLLLGFVLALIHHRRPKSEKGGLYLTVERTMSPARRSEMRIMKGTIADDLVQRGVKKGRKLGEKEGRKLGEKEGVLRAKRDDLIRLLRSRFRRVPRAAQQAIRETRDVRRLDRWFERALDVDSLDDVGLR